MRTDMCPFIAQGPRYVLDKLINGPSPSPSPSLN